MLSWAIGFFILALVAAFFGFGGIASSAAGIAKVLLVLFVIGFIVSLILGLAGTVLVAVWFSLVALTGVQVVDGTGAAPLANATIVIVDGVIAGVGGVLVFLPQILLLFLFIFLPRGLFGAQPAERV